MMVYADKDTFIYEATEDGAKEIDATYDEDYEAWVFKTRKLTSYVVSDVELTDKTVTEDHSSSTTDGGKDNPDTGRETGLYPSEFHASVKMCIRDRLRA